MADPKYPSLLAAASFLTQFLTVAIPPSDAGGTGFPAREGIGSARHECSSLLHLIKVPDSTIS